MNLESWLIQISILKNFHNSELDIYSTLDCELIDRHMRLEMWSEKEHNSVRKKKPKSWLDNIQTEFEIKVTMPFFPRSSALTQSWLRGGHFIIRWVDCCFEYSAVHISVTTAAAAVWNWVISLWSFWLWTHGSHQQENTGI